MKFCLVEPADMHAEEISSLLDQGVDPDMEVCIVTKPCMQWHSYTYAHMGLCPGKSKLCNELLSPTPSVGGVALESLSLYKHAAITTY